MKLSWSQFSRVRELGPIFLVAVSVAIFSTLAGSVFDNVHKVDAEELTGAETSAVPVDGGMQQLDLLQWGVTLNVPLAAELPTLRYTTRSGDSVGLSSVDLEAIGPACLASHGGLGNLVRFPAGSFAASTHGDPAEHFIATVDGHDYAYQTPLNACANTSAAGAIINREESAIFSTLDSLAPLKAEQVR